MKKSTFAIPIEAPDTFEKPNIPEIIAITKKIAAHFNMLF